MIKRKRDSPADVNAASADRNILAVSKLERRALERRTTAERFSDAVVVHAGSLRFVVLHAVCFSLWILWNSRRPAGAPAFDPFPFFALTTVVALESIFLSLFILMSENRSTRRADERAHLDLQVNLLAEHELTKTLELVRALCAHHGLKQAADPEVAEMLRQTEPAMLAREIERQFPSNRDPAVPDESKKQAD